MKQYVVVARLGLLSALLVVASALPLAAQAPPDRAALSAAIDSLAQQELAGGRVAGLAIAVARRGEVLLERGYGMADLEHEVPVTERTVFRLGSITKQFTAAAVMKLVEEGKLSLDDELTRFLPDYPTGGRRITVRHLLEHTSGIKSYTSLGAWKAKERLDLSHEEMLALFQDEPFDFEPGTRFLYNNSGYYLLGMIIERVAGKSYGTYLNETFFRPLGLQSTSYCDERALVKHRARGYTVRAGSLANASPLSMTQPYAAGALCSTVQDLVRWQEALVGGKVVSEESYRAMTTSGTLESGTPTGYGFGLVVGGTLEGRPLVGHDGAINGFITSLAYLPDEELTVAVLINTEGANPGRLSERIMRRALGLPAEVAVKALPLEPGEMARYEGSYDLGQLQIRIFSEGGRLQAQATGQPAFGLLYQGEHTFVAEPAPGIRLVFEVEGERASALMLYQGGLVIPGKRID